MRVDSGLPDFRGKQDFSQSYPALARANLDFSEVASPQTFQRDPYLAWGFYGHRLVLYRETIPHRGFKILRQIGNRMALGMRIFTSNVDGQFQRAGFLDETIHECHGSIHHLQCTNSCDSGIWSADHIQPIVDMDTCTMVSELPSCRTGGSLARPNVLMFNDHGWVEDRANRQISQEATWLGSLIEVGARVVVIERGAGTSIPSVRQSGSSVTVSVRLWMRASSASIHASFKYLLQRMSVWP